jgi:two-component system sensor histidine kinase/response regulator
MWQAISNLISNALHHGEPDGSIVVRIKADTAERIVLSVTNRGVIPAEVVPHLFRAFGAGSIGGRPREGLGLGLHIVREIVHMHGGEVGVQSDETQGTVFSIELPRTAVRGRGSLSGR